MIVLAISPAPPQESEDDGGSDSNPSDGEKPAEERGRHDLVLYSIV